MNSSRASCSKIVDEVQNGVLPLDIGLPPIGARTPGPPHPVSTTPSIASASMNVIFNMSPQDNSRASIIFLWILGYLSAVPFSR